MIQILSPEEAKKIAAGEVIDRPAALVREFIDNALDSGATAIELSIEGGGISKVEVIDNGSGMSKEDLALCVKTHATSKIQSLDDLSRITTLGFRGEALAAAAASLARLEIVTSVDGREAWLLETGADGAKLTQTRRNRGTSVRAFGLFDAIPARKRFLKRETGEAMLCRQIFLEKALAFPGVSFRFVPDQKLKLQLLPRAGEGALQKRFGDAILSANERGFLHTVETAGRGFRAAALFGGPELYRRDRKQQYIFANRRRIQDFGLMQALEYGLAGFFPNDSHPVGAVFVEVDPALADFNIHPAKREVRFADAGAIHHGITSALRNYVNGAELGALRGTAENAASGYSLRDSPDRYGGACGARNTLELSFDSAGGSRALAMEALLERHSDFVPLPFRGVTSAGTEGSLAAEPEPPYGTPTEGTGHRVRLVGRVFDLFILVERGDRLYIIDQHAAHERILYNRFLSAPAVSQELLVAVPFTTADEGEDKFLQAKKDELLRLGVTLENEGGGSWRIEALPAGWGKTDDAVEEILSLRTAGENLAERWAARLACRAAIKDGGFLDDNATLALAETVLALADKTGILPRCPHGRPLWTELSREDLFRAVRRVE